MREYEVRILKTDRTTESVVALAHFTDSAAIKAARQVAEGRPFEVWRGMERIYGPDIAHKRPLQATYRTRFRGIRFRPAPEGDS